MEPARHAQYPLKLGVRLFFFSCLSLGHKVAARPQEVALGFCVPARYWKSYWQAVCQAFLPAEAEYSLGCEKFYIVLGVETLLFLTLAVLECTGLGRVAVSMVWINCTFWIVADFHLVFVSSQSALNRVCPFKMLVGTMATLPLQNTLGGHRTAGHLLASSLLSATLRNGHIAVGPLGLLCWPLLLPTQGCSDFFFFFDISMYIWETLEMRSKHKHLNMGYVCVSVVVVLFLLLFRVILWLLLCLDERMHRDAPTQSPLPFRRIGFWARRISLTQETDNRCQFPLQGSTQAALLGQLGGGVGRRETRGKETQMRETDRERAEEMRETGKPCLLWGNSREERRKENVIVRGKVCLLKGLHYGRCGDFIPSTARDLQLLEDGDLTVIGDRGATLSGGQKARVNLARAVYQDADIYLLDDPLSAVDAEVGKHLFQLCICQTLHEKVTILVTHQLQYLKAASHILILKDGQVVQKGTYTEFLKSGVDFGSLLKKENEEAEHSSASGTPTLRKRTFSESSIWSQQSSRPSLKDGAPEGQDAEDTQAVQPEESRSEGKVGFKAYKNYFAAGASWVFIIFLILLNVAAQVFYVLQDWWLSYWTPACLCSPFQTLLLVVSVISVAAAVIPWIIIPLLPLAIIFLVLRRYFLETSRDVKRLESTTRSPVFSHLSSSLQGLWTIRAYRAEDRFQELFDAHQDLHSEAWFLFLTTSRWFAVRLDAICAVFVIVVAFGSLILAKTLDAGQVGLALSYALTLMGMFQWSVRQSAEVENMMISVERVIEYTDLEKEAPWEYQKRPPPDWPQEGTIVFDNMNFTYSLDGPLVLKHLTALIKSREKVGIVGRTGAGKSSLISALFRLSEPEGKIWIDKILTTEIGLHDLRKKMSIIPQEPVLFTGTMRKNLDPFNEHTDEELWNALEEVQLKEAIEELPGKMDTELAESGSNFSVGQRQLVCLARAILKKNRILIIDEATANVDPRTDELIQQKIREKFAQCTVLTIAHRLNTIIDSDKIMVLDSGRLKEYDEPYVLLQNPESLFYKMVQQLGKAEAAALTETAKQVYFRRNYPDIAFTSPVVTDTSNGQPSALTIFETAL
ncbi:Abcc4 [Phodopus roborovskii]|uniref:Abcc4 protein n=1 Tax=Phodopus roborovskii TaxID=109678 RepID=A0AAU9ZRU1_PHORO|nr:Abcc4 [Phodopus roborovskii]